MPILITDRDVEQLVDMQECIKVMENALLQVPSGLAWNERSSQIRTPKGFYTVLQGAVLSSGVVGLKVYTARFPSGSRFLTVLHDSETGDLLALLQGRFCTQLRTGAMTAVATQYMARKDSGTAGIIGTGIQARMQLESICAIRQIHTIKAYDIIPDRARTFSVQMSNLLDIPVLPVESAQECVNNVDIVITSTTAPEPVLLGAWLKPGMHVNSIGGGHMSQGEVDVHAIRLADTVVVEDLNDARKSYADLIHATEQGALAWENVNDLPSIVAGKVSVRSCSSAITLFESHGIAISDVAIAEYLYRKAIEKGQGTPLPLEA